MARKSNGWVKIHYNILKEDLTPSQFKFFVGAILLANPPTSKDSGLVDLSVRQLANELHMSATEVWRREQELAQRDMISFLSKGFKIKNYDYYQGVTNVPPAKQSPPASVSPTEQSVSPTEQSGSPTEQSGSPGEAKSTHKKEEVIRRKKKATTDDSKMLDLLRKLKGWRYDEAEDLAWLRDFMGDFPDFDLGQLKLARDYYSDRPPPKHKGDWRKRLRNWMILKQEFERKEKPGPRGKSFEQYIQEQQEGS